MVEIRVASPTPIPAPSRRPVVVVVGPDPARRGGSQRGSGAPRVVRPPAATAPAPAPPRSSGKVPDAPVIPAGGGALAVTDSGAPDPEAVAAAMAPSSSDATFDDLIRAQGSRLARGRGPGAGGFGADGAGRSGLTLVLGVTGRRVAGSAVVTSPLVVQQRPIACALPRGKVHALVRLLVLRDGTAAAPRLLESSGQPDFDRCAVRYTGGLRFDPGLDRSGRPLDVWVNVEVMGVGPEMM